MTSLSSPERASSLAMVVMSPEIGPITTIERLDLRKQTIRRLTTTTKRLESRSLRAGRPS
jgi:hypothetical protein